MAKIKHASACAISVLLVYITADSCLSRTRMEPVLIGMMDLGFLLTRL